MLYDFLRHFAFKFESGPQHIPYPRVFIMSSIAPTSRPTNRQPCTCCAYHVCCPSCEPTIELMTCPAAHGRDAINCLDLPRFRSPWECMNHAHIRHDRAFSNSYHLAQAASRADHASAYWSTLGRVTPPVGPKLLASLEADLAELLKK